MKENENLQEIVKSCKGNVFDILEAGGIGHSGGSLSVLEILVALYYKIAKINPEIPKWEDRDRFILSKAHACPVLYGALAENGDFDKSELLTSRKLNSRLQGHAHIKTPGVEMSGGSLGQGLSFGVGLALSAKLDQKNYKTYVLLGDGELNEGQIWEAIMTAKKYELGNLVAIVDKNGIQNDRFTHEVMDLNPLPEKWKSFGWECFEVDGHDVKSLIEVFQSINFKNSKPKVIIADTVKGKGVSFMENNPDFHGKAANPDQLKQAIAEINNH